MRSRRGILPGTISWFRTADGYLGLFQYEEGVAVALDAAVGAGGTLLKAATELPFAVSGYFADPDGYVWEVAYNPSFPIGDDGRLTIA